MSDKFWLVWNPLRNPPSKQHASQGAAFEEAGRLAAKHPDDRIIVLESIGECVAVATVSTTMHALTTPTPEPERTR